jgi:hypothetical protein
VAFLKSAWPLALLTLIVGATVTLAYWNRAHEKVIGLYAAAFAGAVASLLSVVLILTPEATRTEFPVVYIFDPETLAPFDHADANLRWYSHSILIRLARPIADAYPKPKDPADPLAASDRGQDAYLDVAFRHVLEQLAITFGPNWEPTVTRFDLHTGRHSTVTGRADEDRGFKVSLRNDMTKVFPAQPLLRAEAYGMDSFYLPPRTVMTGTSVPDGREHYGHRLTLQNSFCTVNIGVRKDHGMGGTGTFRTLLHLPLETDARYYSAAYVVTVDAAFSRWYSGHPDMPRYKTWVSLLARELRANLDAEERWRETKAYYLLTTATRQNQPADGPIPAPTK